MSYLFSVNDLIEGEDELGNTSIERILWIDEHQSLAFVMDIFALNGFPQLKKLTDIFEGITAGYLSWSQHDPWASIVQEEHLSQKDKEIRDKAWAIILSLISGSQEPSIYQRNIRGSLVSRAATEHSVTEKTVYKYLRRYWQRGKNRNALLPDYVNSGGKGKAKKAGDKKRGRPRKYALAPQIGVGVNINESSRRTFRVAINRFYNNSTNNSLKTAYELMLKEYYAEDFIYENGVRKSILIPQAQKPSFIQFKYWYEKEQDIQKTLTSRKGASRYALNNRAILGTSTMETLGPGSRYQIDATVVDVYLVSSYNRSWVIGRPVIYVIIDVFSRMITGVYVGLEGPSWLGAMMALANAATDKVQFCGEYGITITPSDWPCHHLPDAILGDRGELAGKMASTLITNLHVRVENAAAYRADWKGIVERRFRIIHEYIKPFVPGYVDIDFRQRGGRDYRLDGKLDIHQFTEIIIYCILYHNNEHYLVNYDREEMMIADDVPSKAIKLWEWGIANRSGRIRTFPEDIVKLNLMPTGIATITARGIKFKGMRYSCEKAIRELWFDRARSQNSNRLDKLDISYDARNPNFIYIRDPNGRGFEKCFLVESESRYLNKDLHEIEYLQEIEKLESQKREGERQQASVDLAAHIEHIVSVAYEMTDRVQDETRSNARRVADIRTHRAREKSEIRSAQAFELAKPETPSSPSGTEHQREDKFTQKSGHPNHLELLRKKRQERMGGNTE